MSIKNDENFDANEFSELPLTVFATANDDVELLQKVKVSEWDIRKANSINALGILDRIIGVATDNISELGDFGISPALLQELSDRRNELADLFIAPRQAILSRKLITSSIKSLTKEIDNLLKFSLDKLAGVLKPSQPAFFVEYTNARIIVDYKGKSINNDNPEQDDGFDFSG